MAGFDNLDALDEGYLRRTHFNDAAVAAVQDAGAELKLRDRYDLDAPALVLGLLHDRGGVVARIIRHLGETPERVDRAVRSLVDRSTSAQVPPGSGEGGAKPLLRLTPEVRQVFKIAIDEAMRTYADPRFVGPEHLLLGIIRVDADDLGVVMKQAGISLERARRARDEVLGR